MSRNPLVSILILNYESYKQTIECIESFLQQNYGNYDVVVIDNDSSNDSYLMLTDRFKKNDRVNVLQSGSNLGYAGGNNYGAFRRLQRGDVDYFLIANSDISLTNHNYLKAIVEYAESRADIGVIGSKVVLPNGYVQGPYGRPNIWLLILQYMCPLFWFLLRNFRQWRLKRIRTPKRVYRTIGACMLLKAKPFAEIGGFDENTFLYGEEDILAEKLLEKGLHFYYLPTITVLHKQNGPAKSGQASRMKTLSHTINSMIHYFRTYQKCPEWGIWLYRNSAFFYEQCFGWLR